MHLETKKSFKSSKQSKQSIQQLGLRLSVISIILFTVLFGLSSCQSSTSKANEVEQAYAANPATKKDQPKKAKKKNSFLGSLFSQKSEYINPSGMDIKSRIVVPDGFERVAVTPNSYGHYLRHLPVKEDGAKVYYYDGREKQAQNVHCAVVDIDVGKRDLQQCADAVMRLRSEYLFEQKKYQDIHFNYTNGFRADYSKWRTGQRIKVTGNKCKWVTTQEESTSYKSFRKYMDQVFMYAGTLSLSKELKPVEVEDIQIGDVFIWGGSPGHAILVMDVAVNKATNEKLFLLAQSYMPAQNIHVLNNPNDRGLSPWYSIDFGKSLNTPEWRFERNALKRF